MNTGETIALIKAFGNGGGSGSLPPVTSEDNGKVLAVKDGAWAADSNLFVVNMPTYNTADKTYAETVAAVEAGKNVVVTWNGKVYTLLEKTASEMLFVGNTAVSSNLIFGSAGIVRFKSTSISVADVFRFLNNPNTADNGSELIVKNGAWAMQKKKFIVTLTPTDLDYSGTMDKTANEITAAYEAGQEIVFNVVGFPGFDHVYIPAAWCTYATDAPRCAACATLVDVNSGTQIIIMTSDADNGAVYFTSIYSLTHES